MHIGLWACHVAVLVAEAGALLLRLPEADPASLEHFAVLTPAVEDEELSPLNQAEHVRPGRSSRYKRLADSEEMEQKEHMETYEQVGSLLRRVANMSHSREILEYVMSHPESPTLPHGGCLYLPSNQAWRSFYRNIEHPYPPLFAEMVANSYYPDCNPTALSGLWLPSACGANRMWGSHGCFSVSSRGKSSGIEVYETEGHIGLPEKWSRHINMATKQRSHLRRANRTIASSSCGRSNELDEVPRGKKLVLPTVYVVCRSSEDDWRITRDMVEEQNKWANQAYSGGSPWTRTSFDDSDRPPSVDMQIQFKLVNVSFVTDRDCAKYGFTKMYAVTRYNPRPLDYFTVVIITDDQSGVLGQSEFPQDHPEDSQEQMVVVSAAGFRHFASSTQSGDMAYDEGDTVVHEAGHGLGLYHTFEDGCGISWSQGDWVDDTNPEQLPHYACVATRSCGQADPVHNFMDYSPDSCMMGFTEGQKRRAWCAMRRFRPTLFEKALQ